MRLFARLLSGGSEREALLISCHLEDALANNRLFRHASGQLVCADDDNERQERYIYIYINARIIGYPLDDPCNQASQPLVSQPYPLFNAPLGRVRAAAFFK